MPGDERRGRLEGPCSRLRRTSARSVLWCGALADQRDAIGFAEKVLELLDEGRYTATYKYAVLLVSHS